MQGATCKPSMDRMNPPKTEALFQGDCACGTDIARIFFGEPQGSNQ